MTTYRNIHGRSIQAVSTDPTESVAEGQVWYNTSSNTFKSVVAGEAWSSASPLITGRYLTGGFGTPTAGVISTGQAPGPAHYDNTEHYNGSGWTSETAYPAPGYAFAGAGTQTAGLAAGGNYPSSSRVTTSNTYNGTSWTATGSLPVAADNLSFCGNTRTGAIGAVGRTPSTGNSGTNTSVVYDGSSFSSGPNLNTARMYGNAAGSGTGTAGLIWGGFIDPSPNAMTNTEEYNGSSWTNGGSLNTASSFPSGFGTQTDTVCQVNSPNYQGSEKYDGTSWTALPDIGIATPGGLYGNKAFSPTGTSSGYVTSMSPTNAATAEFNRTANTIIAAAWASGGTIPDSKRDGFVGSIGTQTAGLAFGGEPVNAETFEYNGATWAIGGDMGTGRRFPAGFGTQSAAGAAGGNSSVGFSAVSNYETYDGSSWSEQPDLNTARASVGGAGTTTSAVVFGGSKPAAGSDVEEYDGSSWTSVTSLPAVRTYHTGAGTQTAALATGGVASTSSPYGIYSSSLEYDGSSWTTGGDLNTGRALLGGAGTQTAFIAIGGDTNLNPHSTQTTCEQYNGTSFFTIPSLSVVGQNFRGTGGTTSAAYEAGGFGPGGTNVNTTEEYDGETTSINIETLTQS